MFLDHSRVSDARRQSLGLKFTFITESQKLIIEALCSNDNQQYIGSIISNPYILLDDIKEMLQFGQFKILQKNENLLKIKVGATPIEMVSKPKSQIKDLQIKVTESIKKQAELQEFIMIQNKQIDELIFSISDIKATVGQMKKQNPEVSSIPQSLIKQIKQEIKQDLYQKIKLQKLNPKYQPQKISYQNKMQIFQEKIKKLNIMCRQGLDDLYGIHNELFIQIKKVKQTFTEEMQIVKDQIQQNRKSIDIEQILELKTKMNKMNKMESQMKYIMDSNTQIFNENFCKIQELNLTIDHQNSRLQNVQSSIKSLQISQKDQQRKEGNLKNQQNQIIKSSLTVDPLKWSQNLKANTIKIDKNIITITKKINESVDLALIQAELSQTVKSKYNWAVKILKQTGLFVGIGLKNALKEINFNFQTQLLVYNHGLTLMGNNGRYRLSHYPKKLTKLKKGFTFAEGDVIFLEYDPIDLVLRFRKNKNGQMFEIPIFLPPQNEAYHPCVVMYEQNCTVQLLPGQPLS